MTFEGAQIQGSAKIMEKLNVSEVINLFITIFKLLFKNNKFSYF